MKLKLTITENGLVCQTDNLGMMTLHGSVASNGVRFDDELDTRVYGYRNGNTGCIRVSQCGVPENFYLPVGASILIETGETHDA